MAKEFITVDEYLKLGRPFVRVDRERKIETKKQSSI